MKREVYITKRAGLLSCNMGELWDILTMWLQTIGNGEWVLKLEKKQVQRSLNQNALLWIWMQVLSKEWAEATGQHYTKEQWKEYFMRTLRPVTMLDGTTVGASTSAMTQDEMTELLTEIQAYAATELGIRLRGAEDKMFDQWKGQYE